MEKTVLIRIYQKDVERLNQYMALLMLAKKQRLSVADTFHEILEKNVKPIIEKTVRERNAV